jgi:hypothetical protein
MTGNLVLPDERKVDILCPSTFGGARVMVDILYLVEKLRRKTDRDIWKAVRPYSDHLPS